ncbi:hydantoinase/oxoprolinase family protein [Mesorhizobium sp. B2-6-5]|uniref:hydantoinase/oxoprolinase family protein n=1 Tax=Mesorhizobium sp. B2-6-5 TaxID=2589912 RepID=UPI0011293DE1|nr:hydantoinase/oxoprolinase family protein [Mesorhizobium sp. B2-6-5]TPJ38282.1 hydantoinase/oxoprolinase family protein [Mesorhizobium sp. B2-6-5]
MTASEIGESTVGVEIGGTFTDLVWLRPDGTIKVGKVPSTPRAIHQAVIDGVAEAEIPLSSVGQFAHGSTVATNTLLTRRGAACGLITTKGFRDLLEIGNSARTGSIYRILYRKAVPPVPRNMVVEVAERTNAQGAVEEQLDLDAAWSDIQPLISRGAESIAICLLHAYKNPKNEIALRDLIEARAPGISVFCSHQVSPEFREFERAMTTSVNAYVAPVVSDYVGALDTALRYGHYNGVLRIMQSNGGVMPASAAAENAVRMLLSGPAAGVRAGIWFARRNQIDDIITLDMGGTSTDVAIAPGSFARMVPEISVDELPIRTAAIDISTVGAGGGSIAFIDSGGFLAVGPQSAGALPGPACYDRGGHFPTVTDAQVVSGLLRPRNFFGGKMVLREDLANQALATLGLGSAVAEAADAVVRVINANMASAVRLVSTSRGIDPREFTLVAIGGGGPLHGALVGEELGMRKVLVPWCPGLASAFGLLIADVVIDIVRTELRSLNDETMSQGSAKEILEQCRKTAAENGMEEGTYSVQTGLDLRYQGQAFELTIWCDYNSTAGEIREQFEALHAERYGYRRAALPVEVVNLRARVVKAAKVDVTASYDRSAKGERAESRIRCKGNWMTAQFLARDMLAPGDVLPGPAIVEEPTSTTFVPPGWTARCLQSGDLLLESDNA